MKDCVEVKCKHDAIGVNVMVVMELKVVVVRSSWRQTRNNDGSDLLL